MKNLIYLLLFFLPFSLKAQTIDTTYVKSFPSCKIVPLYIKIPGLDSLQSERIHISNFVMDFASKVMEIHYSFCTLDGTVIYSGIEIFNNVNYLDFNKQIVPYGVMFQSLGSRLKIDYQ